MTSATFQRASLVALLGIIPFSMPLAGARDTPQTSTPQPKLDPLWKQIKSGDVTVVSDGSEAVMRRAIRELTAFRQAIQSLFPSWRVASPVPTLLVLFKDQDSFDTFKPRDADGHKQDLVIGYFAERPHVNYMVTFVQSGGRLNLSTILHEYTHFLGSRNLRTLPTWLSEGLAEFYSTFESGADDGRPVIGKVPAGRVQTIRQGGRVPLEQMLRPDSAAKLIQNQRTAMAFYAQSWALVHYLLVGHEGRRAGQLNAYLSRLAEGRSLDQAFREGFETSYGELQLELSIYMLRTQYPMAVLPKPALGDEPDAPAVPLPERNALQIQGDVLVSIGAWSDAEDRLNKARAIDRAFSPTQMSLGLVQMGREKNAAARSVLEPAARADPKEFGLHFYLGSLLLGEEDYAGAATALGRATELIPESSTAWIRLSVARLGLRDRSGADEALERATAVDSRRVWALARSRAIWHMRLDTVIIEDLTAALKEQPMDAETTADAALLAAASSWRLRQPELATPLLKAARANADETKWTSRLLDFALGQVDEATVLKAATSIGEITEARTYAGLRHLFDGRRAQAMPHLQWVRDRGDKNVAEYRMVTDVLKGLSRDGQ